MVRAIELVHDGQGRRGHLPGKHRRACGRLDETAAAARAWNGRRLRRGMPSRTEDFVLLDAGRQCRLRTAAPGAVRRHGQHLLPEILGLSKPRVGILSNGSEDTKGNELTREALKLCTQLDLNFIGYVEGFDLFDDARGCGGDATGSPAMWS